jgi:hypothetical protein
MAGAKLSFTLTDMVIQEIVPHHTQELAPEIEKKETCCKCTTSDIQLLLASFGGEHQGEGSWLGPLHTVPQTGFPYFLTGCQ